MTLIRTKLALLLALSLCANSFAAPIEVTGGDTFVQLDVNVLRELDLQITSVSDADLISMPGFIGFAINARDASPPTTFIYDSETFEPSSGSVEHVGTITLNDSITVGDFQIAAAEGRPDGNSGFIVRTTVSDDDAENIPLFDIPMIGDGPGEVSLDFGEDFLNVDGPLVVAPELAAFLGDESLTGATIGAVKKRAVGVLVPEPGSFAVAFLAILGVAVLLKRR